ncbi:MAG: histidinol-phosphatase, partial [Planctomycetota bacterium]
SGLNKAIQEMNPFPAMLREMSARSIPVVIGADAHCPERVADRFEDALDLLAECGFETVNCFLGRERREIGIADTRASLRPLQPAAT